jgi:hypothetical protein
LAGGEHLTTPQAYVTFYTIKEVRWQEPESSMLTIKNGRGTYTLLNCLMGNVFMPMYCKVLIQMNTLVKE